MAQDTIATGIEPTVKHVEDEAWPDVHADLDQVLAAEGLEASLEEAPGRPWRVAEALLKLRAQINALAPGRSKASDGTIGDAAHATRDSDHNPWVIDGGQGVVTALDVTHDPDGGCDAHDLAEILRLSRDRRIKYIISNRRIASYLPKGGQEAWAWRAYTGANPHNKHCHISVRETKALFDDRGDWAIASAFEDHEGPSLVEAAPTEAEIKGGLQALLEAAQSNEIPILTRIVALQQGAESLFQTLGQNQRAFAPPAGVPDEEALEGVVGKPSFEAVKGEYEALFASCVIKTGQKSVVAWHRQMILNGKARYQAAEARTQVPWWFIGVIHAMEASFNFKAHLHNGDPLTAKTVQVPKGRPPGNPPFTWLDSAVDALSLSGFNGLSDWSLARCLYRWEAYNGFGYRRPAVNIPSPYLWSFSNHYAQGKYVADGSYSPTAVSKQCGCAVMLKALQNAGDIVI